MTRGVVPMKQRILHIVDDDNVVVSVKLGHEEEEPSTVRVAILWYLCWFVVALSPLFFISK